MKRVLILLVCVTMLYGLQAQSFTVTYDFATDLSATVTGEQAVTADNLIAGGTKQTLEEVLNDNGTSAFKAHIKNNNATDYTFSRVQLNIRPKDGYKIVINEIKFTQRSSIAGEAGKDQTYLFRIGCSKNGVLPNKDNTQQSTANTLFYDTYKADSFTPGADFNTVSGEDFFSAFATARGKATSNDEFDWYIDKVEISGSAVKLLSLPTFSVTYGFDGGSKTPVIDGSNVTASDMTANSNTEGVTTSGLYWIKTNKNTNTIGYKLMGLYCDITPASGYEVVMKNYSITHAGSGVAGQSRVNRIGLYRDALRSAAGVLIKKVDFVEADYAGRDIYGDAVAAGKFKTSVVEDDVVLDAQHFFTISVNRTGPDMSEYWTVDNVIFNGWIVPDGRGTLLNSLVAGQTLLLGAIVGTEPGEYQQSVYDDFKNLLITANDTLNNPATTQGVIDAYTTQLADAVAAFPSQAIGANATLAVDTTSGHEILERMHGYNSRLADEGWSFRNPELLKAMDTLGIGWLRYLSGTRNNGFNMNIGMYEPEDIEQLIKFDELPGGNIECHKRVEVKGPQLVDDLYQALGENNARLVVTWSGFIGEPWEAALFAKFCEDNHIEVDLWQFVNEPYFYNPNRNAWFWNNGADYARKMHPIADSIKAYDPDAMMAPNSCWDNPKEIFSQQIADYTPRFYNAFSKHTYAAYNTNTSTAPEKAIKELVGGVYFTGTEAYPDILEVYGNDIPVYVTEAQTWNIVSASFLMTGIYMSEYILRMAAHPNTKLIAKHSFNTAVKTAISNHKTTIDNAYNNNTPLNTDALVYGIGFTVEGLAQKVVNDGINHCTYVYDGTITGDATVEADNKNTSVKELPALYSGVYDGTNGKKYIIITNKSGIAHNLTVTGLKLPATVDMHYVTSYSPYTGVADLEIKNKTVNSDEIVISPYSITRIEWLHQVEAPSASRIFDVKVGDGQASLKWWTKQNADSYMVYYGTDANALDQSKEVAGTDVNNTTVTGLTNGNTYYFAVAGKNSAGVGDTSKVVDAKIAIPDAPVLVSAYGRTDTRLSGKITLLWRSVTDAEGYKIFYGKSSGVYTDSVDARNCSGFRLTKLDQDTEYYIAIAAYNDLGNGTLSNEITATTIHERPVSPHQVRVHENGLSELVVEWERSKDFDFGSNFKVYRSDKPYTGYELVASNVVSTTYTDKTILSPGKYYYTVKGENEKGESFYPSNKSMVDKKWTTQTESVLTDGKTIAVYPNPAKDYINIILSEDISNARYNIYNVVGASVMKGDLEIENRLDISDFQAGIYLVKVSTNSGETTEMIQIQ